MQRSIFGKSQPPGNALLYIPVKLINLLRSDIRKSIRHASWLWFKPLATSYNDFADNLKGIVASLSGLSERTRENYQAFRLELVDKEKIYEKSRKKFVAALATYEKEERGKRVGPFKISLISGTFKEDP